MDKTVRHIQQLLRDLEDLRRSEERAFMVAYRRGSAEDQERHLGAKDAYSRAIELVNGLMVEVQNG